jgi:hypothetical protein
MSAASDAKYLTHTGTGEEEVRLSDHHRSDGWTLSAFSRRSFGGRNQSPIGVNLPTGIVVGEDFSFPRGSKIEIVTKPIYRMLLIARRKLREEDL